MSKTTSEMRRHGWKPGPAGSGKVYVGAKLYTLREAREIAAYHARKVSYADAHDGGSED